MGIDIGPLTYGELVHAYKAKLDYDRGQESRTLAAIGNAPHFKPRRQLKPEDFYRQLIRRRQTGQKLTSARLRSLKPLFKGRRFS